MHAHRRHPSATGVGLITLMVIGAVSVLVMVASDGGLQWFSAAVALAAPLLARRVLSPPLVDRIEPHRNDTSPTCSIADLDPATGLRAIDRGQMTFGPTRRGRGGGR